MFRITALFLFVAGLIVSMGLRAEEMMTLEPLDRLVPKELSGITTSEYDKRLYDPHALLLDQYRDSVKMLQELYPDILEYRETAKDFALQLRERLKTKNDVFKTEELQQIDQIAAQRSIIGNEIKKVIDAYREDIQHYYDVKRGTTLKNIYGRRVVLALTMGIVLLDNYNETNHFFQESRRLRQVVNMDNDALNKDKDILEDALDEIYSFKNRRDKKKATKIYDELKANFPELFQEEEMAFMNSILENSVSFQQKTSGIKFLIDRTFKRKAFADYMNTLGRRILWGVSKVFALSLAQITWGHGSLNNNPELNQEIKDMLQPGDVFLERFYNKVSARLIPGKWGHVAMWLGTEAQLRELGIWDHELVKPYQKQIQNGKSVIESLRYGPTLNTLEHFMDIDCLMIARTHEPLTHDQRIEVLLRGIAELGKSYNYDMEVQSSDGSFCSQLVAVAYHGIIQFPYDHELGTWTLSPKLFGETISKTDTFDILMLFDDGVRQSGDLKATNLKMIDDFEKNGINRNRKKG